MGVSQGDSPRDSYEDLKQQRGHEALEALDGVIDILADFVDEE